MRPLGSIVRLSSAVSPSRNLSRPVRPPDPKRHETVQVLLHYRQTRVLGFGRNCGRAWATAARTIALPPPSFAVPTAAEIPKEFKRGNHWPFITCGPASRSRTRVCEGVSSQRTRRSGLQKRLTASVQRRRRGSTGLRPCVRTNSRQVILPRVPAGPRSVSRSHGRTVVAETPDQDPSARELCGDSLTVGSLAPHGRTNSRISRRIGGRPAGRA